MDLPDGCSNETGVSVDSSLNAPRSPSKAGDLVNRDRLSDPERLTTEVSFQSLVNVSYAYFFAGRRGDAFFAVGFLFCTINALPGVKLALCFFATPSAVRT